MRNRWVWGLLGSAVLFVGVVWESPAQGAVNIQGVAGACTSPIPKCFINGLSENILELNSDIDEQKACRLGNFVALALVNVNGYRVVKSDVFTRGNIIRESFAPLHVFGKLNTLASSIVSGRSNSQVLCWRIPGIIKPQLNVDSRVTNAGLNLGNSHIGSGLGHAHVAGDRYRIFSGLIPNPEIRDS